MSAIWKCITQCKIIYDYMTMLRWEINHRLWQTLSASMSAHVTFEHTVLISRVIPIIKRTKQSYTYMLFLDGFVDAVHIDAMEIANMPKQLNKQTVKKHENPRQLLIYSTKRALHDCIGNYPSTLNHWTLKPKLERLITPFVTPKLQIQNPKS